MALAGVAAHLPATLAGRALDIVLTLGEPAARAPALGSLAPCLDGPGLRRAVSIASDLEHPVARAVAFLGLADAHGCRR